MKNCLFPLGDTWFHAQLKQKILDGIYYLCIVSGGCTGITKPPEFIVNIFFCICLFLYVSMQSAVNGIRFRPNSFRALTYLPRYYLNDLNLNAGKTSNHRAVGIKAACYLENWKCNLTFTSLLYGLSIFNQIFVF